MSTKIHGLDEADALGTSRYLCQCGEDGLRRSCVGIAHATAVNVMTFVTRASLGLSTPFSRGGGAAPAHLHSGAVEVMHAIYWQREGGSALSVFWDVI